MKKYFLSLVVFFTFGSCVSAAANSAKKCSVTGYVLRKYKKDKICIFPVCSDGIIRDYVVVEKKTKRGVVVHISRFSQVQCDRVEERVSPGAVVTVRKFTKELVFEIGGEHVILSLHGAQPEEPSAGMEDIFITKAAEYGLNADHSEQSCTIL